MINRVSFFIAAICLLFPSLVIKSQTIWQEINTVDALYQAYPERMRTMLQTVNLDLKGLEKVKKAYENDNFSSACKHLLDYYKEGNSAQYLRKKQPPVSTETDSNADSIINDVFVFYKVTDQIPRDENGHLRWDWSGPDNDLEWTLALNRHHPVSNLLSVYYKTGNPKYARYIDTFIKDWIISNLPYPGVKNRTAMWRGLEVSFREKVWARVFYGLINTEFISPATQLLILSSLPEHAHYARNFHGHGNWLTMEISGLATIATAWPEFKESKKWLEYAVATMTGSLKEQVYPDGTQTELTSHYHGVALNNFCQFYNICSRAYEPLTEFYISQLEKMWNYLAFTMRPDGYGLLNNDSDLDYNRERIFKAASEYGRKDWQYIATNGETGTKPDGESSILFPWAGHLISRSGYDLDAHWSFFDIGPLGTSHQHFDKLHISISAFGYDLLVDAGRFAYSGDVADRFRGYAIGSQSHNIIMVDGKGQIPGPKLAHKPLSKSQYKITEEFDYARGSLDGFIDVKGECKQMRALFYVRNNFWIIVDQITTCKPRKIEALWHWHPNSKVAVENQIVSTENKHGNLKIIPLGGHHWKVSLIKGQERPEIQGWYSKAYNTYEPNISSIYSTKIDSNSTFVWVLFPSEGDAPNIQAEILSQDYDAVKVKVTNPEMEEWIVTIPFSDSSKAMLQK